MCIIQTSKSCQSKTTVSAFNATVLKHLRSESTSQDNAKDKTSIILTVLQIFGDHWLQVPVPQADLSEQVPGKKSGRTVLYNSFKSVEVKEDLFCPMLLSAFQYWPTPFPPAVVRSDNSSEGDG